MPRIVVVNVSAHGSDYGELVANRSERNWRKFLAPHEGVFAIAHPSAARECVTELLNAGQELYLAWHSRDHDASKKSLQDQAVCFVDYQHFETELTADNYPLCWNDGLRPLVAALRAGADTITSADMWTKLLQIIRNNPGPAAVAADDLLNLMQQTLWRLETERNGRRRAFAGAVDEKDDLENRLLHALRKTTSAEQVEECNRMSKDAWAALEAMAHADLSAVEQHGNHAADKLRELAHYLFGGDDEASKGLIDIEPGGRTLAAS